MFAAGRTAGGCTKSAREWPEPSGSGGPGAMLRDVLTVSWG
jgi:hypothetical protein